VAGAEFELRHCPPPGGGEKAGASTSEQTKIGGADTWLLLSVKWRHIRHVITTVAKQQQQQQQPSARQRQ